MSGTAPDTILMTQGLASVKSDNIMITPAGGTQQTLAAALGAAGAPASRVLPLTQAKTIAGLALPATAAGTSPTVVRVAGSSMMLEGVSATSGLTSTTEAMWEFDLPTTFQGGSAVPWSVNAQLLGSGTIVSSATVLGVSAYIEINGAEAGLVVSGGGQEIPTGSATTLSGTIAGTGLAAGTRMVLVVSATADAASGTVTPAINQVAYTA